MLPHTWVLAVKLLRNPCQIDNMAAADYWNTLGGMGGVSQCHCRSSVTTPWPLQLSRVDEVIAQLLRISAVPDGCLLRVCVCVWACVCATVCVHAYGTPGTHRTRRHQTVTCVVLVTVPVFLFPYQTNLGTCSTGAGQQRSLAKLSSLNMKSEKKETHTSYKGWYYIPNHNFRSAVQPNFAFLLCAVLVKNTLNSIPGQLLIFYTSN